MIDLHNHLLGDDELISDLTEALTCCQRDHRDGISEIVITQRLSNTVTHDPEPARKFETCLRKLRTQLSEIPGLSLKLSRGYEWVFSSDLPRRLREFPGNPAINESNYLLISLPAVTALSDHEKVFHKIRTEGYLPIISHPECSRAIRRTPAIINRLIKLGCLIQVDALSVTGGYTKEIELFTRELLECGQVHFIATRASRQTRREASLNSAFECASQIVGRGAARYLVDENPSTVLANATKIKDWSRSIADCGLRIADCGFEAGSPIS